MGVIVLADRLLHLRFAFASALRPADLLQPTGLQSNRCAGAGPALPGSATAVMREASKSIHGCSAGLDCFSAKSAGVSGAAVEVLAPVKSGSASVCDVVS